MRHLSKLCVLLFAAALIFSLAGCPSPDTPNPNAGYTISLPSSVSNGTLTAGRTTAKAGDSVSLFVTPEWGYEIDYLTVKDSNNNAITVTNHEDALPAYSEFTMPASNVTVSVAFKRFAFNWSYGVDEDSPNDPGEITDFATNSTGNGCSFNVEFTSDDTAYNSYSQAKVGVGNIYIKGGVWYKFSWTNQTAPEDGWIYLDGFWLRNDGWHGVNFSSFNFISGQQNSIYVIFKSDENEVVDVIFRPNHVSGDYVLSNFEVEEAMCNVTFDTNGGSPIPETQEVLFGTRATKPTAAPTKNGFVFLGWQKDGSYFNFNTYVEGNITLTAVWSEHYGTKAPNVAKEVGDIVFKDGSATPYTAGLTLCDEQKKAAIALIFYKGTGLNSDTLNSDGTWTSSESQPSRTLGVGLKQVNGCAWCSPAAGAYSACVYPASAAGDYGCDKYIETILCERGDNVSGVRMFTGDKNGSNNLEQIAAFLGENNDTGVGENSTKTSAEAAVLYPAFYFAKNYKEEIIGSEATSRVAGTAYEDGWYLPSVAELSQIYSNGIGANKVFDINAACQALSCDNFVLSYAVGYLSSSQSEVFDGEDQAGPMNYYDRVWAFYFSDGICRWTLRSFSEESSYVYSRVRAIREF